MYLNEVEWLSSKEVLEGEVLELLRHHLALLRSMEIVNAETICVGT